MSAKEMPFLIYSLYVYSLIINYSLGSSDTRQTGDYKNKKHDSCLQGDSNLGEGIG